MQVHLQNINKFLLSDTADKLWKKTAVGLDKAKVWINWVNVNQQDNSVMYLILALQV
mgnify:CR=1 FL=1